MRIIKPWPAQKRRIQEMINRPDAYALTSDSFLAQVTLLIEQSLRGNDPSVMAARLVGDAIIHEFGLNQHVITYPQEAIVVTNRVIAQVDDMLRGHGFKSIPPCHQRVYFDEISICCACGGEGFVDVVDFDETISIVKAPINCNDCGSVLGEAEIRLATLVMWSVEQRSKV